MTVKEAIEFLKSKAVFVAEACDITQLKIPPGDYDRRRVTVILIEPDLVRDE